MSIPNMRLPKSPNEQQHADTDILVASPVEPQPTQEDLAMPHTVEDGTFSFNPEPTATA